MLTPFVHIRFEKNFRFDDPADGQISCGPLFNFLEMAMVAFIPAPEKLEIEFDPRDFIGKTPERLKMLSSDSAADRLRLRQSELEETVQLVDECVRTHRKKAEQLRSYDNEILASFYWGADFVSFCRELRNEKEKYFAWKKELASGREISIFELHAAATIQQAERTERAYLSGDIEDFAFLFSDTAFVAMQLLSLIIDEEKAVRASRNARLSHARLPISISMSEIEKRFMKMLRKESSHLSDSAFAREMIRLYPDIKNEGSIKNACTRWRKKI